MNRSGQSNRKPGVRPAARWRTCGRGAAVLVALLLVLRGAPGAETLTLATYNVENYGPADRMTAEGFRKAYPKPETEKAALRRVIKSLAADVLFLDEIGGEAYLEELRRDLGRDGVGFAHAAVAHAADADRHVAVLSRRPFVRVTTFDQLTFPYFGGTERVKRGLLEVVLPTEAGELTIYAVHLKSRYTDRPDDPLSALRRTAEATAIRDLILRRFPDPARGRFVLLGDFNDTPASKPLERVQRRGATVIAELLPESDSRGEGWTYWYRKDASYLRFDHVLVSPALRNAVVDGTARIADPPGTAEASDHRPVVVRLRW